MHKEILTKEQIELLPLIKKFSKKFYLVGGTAIAFHIGHRRSIDFDLFSSEGFNNLSIKNRIVKTGQFNKTIVNRRGEYTIMVNGVQMTFFHYPFKIESNEWFDKFLRMPDLLTLAAMKAYALGMRAKWKDYVDLYFIIKHYHGIDKIIKCANHIFGVDFNEKIFRTQLSYFDDINYSEKVAYMKGFAVPDKVVKKALIEFSVQ